LDNDPNKLTRRSLLRGGLRAAAALGAAGGVAALAGRAKGEQVLWQIDPAKCTACGNCQTYCVLRPSAVKCVHAFAMCGYCKLCTGYFEPDAAVLDTGAENQICPTGAIQRSYVEDPYYEYVIDEGLCIACGRCVKGCSAFGNSSLFLQIRHDRCVHCNQCAIATACPAQAIRRVPASRPYLLKSEGQK